MSNVDFRTLLNKPADDIQRPKPLPAGTYHGTIAGHEYGESQNKKTPYVRFAINVNSAGEDVDPEELEGIELSSKKLRRDYYLTEDSLYRLKEFLESLGIEMSGRPLGECVPEATGQPVIIDVVQVANQKEPTAAPFNDIKNLRGES